MSWTERYQAHFQHYFGKPFDIQVFHDPDDFALKVATHDWAMRGFKVLASLGLADLLSRQGEEEFGEVILFTDVKDKEVAAIFVNAMFFILHHDIPLGSRFAIGFAQSQPDFADRYNKTSLYFTRPALPDFFFDDDPINEEKIGQETFDKVRKGDAFGRVYQALFITEEEDLFLDKHGPDVFERELRAAFGFDDEESDVKALRHAYTQAYTVRRPSCKLGDEPKEPHTK